IMAQGGGAGMQRRTVEERVKMTLEKVTPALTLDKDQQTKTDSTFTEYYRAMDKFRETLEPGTRPDRSQFEKFITERDEKLKKVFTEAQFKKWKEEVEPSLRPQRQGGNPPSGGQN
ncbi:MAG TPA: hypothetical protein VM012_12245, partial [Flavitalea sp.]|nr:hypothetical protein [Flavitalea sp.]